VLRKRGPILGGTTGTGVPNAEGRVGCGSRKRGIAPGVSGPTLLVLVLLALEVVGCGWPFKRGERSAFDREPAWLEVVPRSNGEVADLSADDIVRVLQRVGFSDEHIIELGTDVHRALFLSGAAAIMNGKKMEVLLAVKGEHLFIQSNSRGTFVYSLAKGRFGLTPSE